MSKQYFYTVASLPMLQYEEALPISYEEFIEACRLEFSEEEIEELMKSTIAVSETPEGLVGVAETYWHWECGLRNEMVAQRAKNLNVDGQEFLIQGESALGVAEIVSAAVKMDSPLEAEDHINRCRWDYIESLKGFDFYSKDFLFCYSLQLRILERKALFQVERGYENYKTLYNKILENSDYDFKSGE